MHAPQVVDVICLPIVVCVSVFFCFYMLLSGSFSSCLCLCGVSSLCSSCPVCPPVLLLSIVYFSPSTPLTFSSACSPALPPLFASWAPPVAPLHFVRKNVSCTRFVTTTTAAIRPVRNLCLVLLLFPITTTTTTTTMPRQVHWYTGTLVHRYTNTLVHKYTGEQVHWYTGTPVFKYIGTSVQSYTGIPVHGYYGTPVHRCMHWCTGTSL